MKIRLTPDHVRRLKALIAAHPDHLKSIPEALTASIEMATHDAWEKGRKIIEEHDRERTEAWAARRADTKHRTSVRRRRPKSNIRPVIRPDRESPGLAPVATHRQARSANEPTRRARAQAESVTEYVHQPFDKEGAAKARADAERKAAKAAAKAAAAETGKPAADEGGGKGASQ